MLCRFSSEEQRYAKTKLTSAIVFQSMVTNWPSSFSNLGLQLSGKVAYQPTSGVCVGLPGTLAVSRVSDLPDAGWT